MSISPTNATSRAIKPSEEPIKAASLTDNNALPKQIGIIAFFIIMGGLSSLSLNFLIRSAKEMATVDPKIGLIFGTAVFVTLAGASKIPNIRKIGPIALVGSIFLCSSAITYGATSALLAPITFKATLVACTKISIVAVSALSIFSTIVDQM